MMIEIPFLSCRYQSLWPFFGFAQQCLSLLSLLKALNENSRQDTHPELLKIDG